MYRKTEFQHSLFKFLGKSNVMLLLTSFKEVVGDCKGRQREKFKI